MLYRIKSVDNNDSYTVSATIPVTVSSSYRMQVYPSPARAGQTVHLTVPQPGTYSLLPTRRDGFETKAGNRFVVYLSAYGWFNAWCL